MEDKLTFITMNMNPLRKKAQQGCLCQKDFKLDYILRLFHSIRNKPFESYVIQRIWHLLNDERVYFVTQQYFNLNKGSYALVDLYLPQLKLVVEVDECYHCLREQQEKDKARSEGIEKISGVEIRRITIWKKVNGQNVCCSLADINYQIDILVAEIRRRITDMGNSFLPWMGECMFSPSYYRCKGYFSIYENDYVITINDAAAIFGTKVKNRGFLRPGAFDVPGKADETVWCPNVKSREWSNEISNDGMIIREFYKKGDPKRTEHVRQSIQENKKRITFIKMEDILGYNYYKFVGVFVIDAEQSLKENKCVWKRVADTYKLGHGNVSTIKCPYRREDIFY